MADLTTELTELNSSARALLAKYEESFARLDAHSQEYAQQLAQQINDGLSALQSTKDGSLDAIMAKTQEGINALQRLIDGGVGAKVVKTPTISGPQAASIGHQATWSFASESFLGEHVTIASFEVDWGDGNTETIAATNGGATVAHTYSGNENDTYTVQVRAVDSIGNKSEPATASVRLVANQPPTAPAVDAPEEVTKNAQFSIKIHSSTDPDGDRVYYKILDTGLFAFSKTDNIAENEEITVIAPDVNADTTLSFSVAAVDSTGLASKTNIVSMLVRNIIPFEGKLFRTFNVPGTYTFIVPDKKNTIVVEVWGAGGGGGSSGAGTGGAGGNGGYAKSRLSVNPGESITVTVGEGGKGGHYPDIGVYGGRGDGWHGGSTVFGDYLYATGGQAGHGGDLSPQNGGGAGGQGFNGNLENRAGQPGCDKCGQGIDNYDLGKASAATGGAACYTFCYAQDGGDGLVKIYV